MPWPWSARPASLGDDVIVNFAMPSATIAGLVAVGVLRRISWGGVDDAALRSQHSFTHGERLSGLATTVGSWKARMKGDLQADPPVLRIAPPINLFDSSTTDLSILVGLKAVATDRHARPCRPQGMHGVYTGVRRALLPPQHDHQGQGLQEPMGLHGQRGMPSEAALWCGRARGPARGEGAAAPVGEETP